MIPEGHDKKAGYCTHRKRCHFISDNWKGGMAKSIKS